MVSITSYAQYGEDLVLWNALSDVQSGFYIDVGAADPQHESVTKLFYDRGWSGINIEPRPAAHERFCRDRPCDVNLRLALNDSREAAPIKFFEIEAHPGLSTSRQDYADKYRTDGMRCNDYEVPSSTLAAVCEDHVIGPIHFLKVDVEGTEETVLKGADFERFRPWLLAIEATIPCTFTPNHTWEPMIIAAGYEFALFSVINRYYVAKEHSERKSRILPAR